MKKWKMMLLAVTAMQWVACNKEIDYIESIEPFENAYIAEVDTITASSETYIPDSIATSSGLTYFKLGSLTDAIYGKVKSSPVFRMSLPVTAPDLGNTSYFDSIELIIRPDRSYSGDTSVPMQVSAYRLSQDLASSNNTFYAHNRFATQSQALGTGSFRFRPAQSTGDSIRLVMSASLGSELFDMFKRKDAIITDASLFADWFKGIKLATVANGSNLMLEVPKSDSSIFMRIHYHNDEGRPVPHYFDFLMNASVYGFYEMDIDRSGTPLAAMTAGKPLTKYGSTAYYYHQTLTEVNTRFSFPYLKELMKTAEYTKIVSAVLEVKPMQTNLVQFPLPPSLYMYYYQTDGYVDGPAVDASSNNLTGDLVLDAFQGKNTSYTYDITSYINEELATNTYTTQKLLLKSGGAGDQLYQLTAGIPGNTAYASKLIITYLTYKK